MSRLWLRIMLLVAVVLMSAGAGLARAAVVGLNQLAATQLAPSMPALLGPIDARGRNGWYCEPEKAAHAADVRDADLPDDLGR